MENQAGKAVRQIAARAVAKVQGFFRAVRDILETLLHGFFASPERQPVAVRAKSGDRLQGTGDRKSSGE